MTISTPHGVDMHVHAAPSIFPRSETDQTLWQHAKEVGLRGFVLKAHEGSTAERAAILNSHPEGPRVFGSITLNQFVGGWNAAAVDLAVALGARVIWAPTIHALNHFAHYGGPQYREQPTMASVKPWPAVSLYAEDGTVSARVHEVLEVVAAADVVLQTGHLGPHEAADLILSAQEHHVRRIVYTHPDLAVNRLALEDQKAWARKGVWLEKSYLTTLPQWGHETFASLVASIHYVGADRIILQTDLGQAQAILPMAGWHLMVQSLTTAGLSFQDLDRVADQNAWTLLT